MGTIMTNEEINEYHNIKERYDKVALIVVNREYTEIFQSMRDDIKMLLAMIDNYEVTDELA